jgi:hypothetical protein
MRSVLLLLLSIGSLIPDPGSLIGAPGSRIRDPGSTIRDTGFGIRDERFAIRDEGFGMSDSGFGIQGSVVIDRIMAVVSGQPITLSDVSAARQFGLVSVPAGTADPIAYTLDRLIERTLILAEVERFQPPEPDPIEITIRVDELERRAGSGAALEQALSVVGMARDQLRRYFRDDLRITTYLHQRFGGTTADAQRQAAIKTWISELKRRAEVGILYGAKDGRVSK